MHEDVNVNILEHVNIYECIQVIMPKSRLYLSIHKRHYYDTLHILQ